MAVPPPGHQPIPYSDRLLPEALSKFLTSQVQGPGWTVRQVVRGAGGIAFAKALTVAEGECLVEDLPHNDKYLISMHSEKTSFRLQVALLKPGTRDETVLEVLGSARPLGTFTSIAQLTINTRVGAKRRASVLLRGECVGLLGAVYEHIAR